MLCRPERSEAAPYYFGYIDEVSGDDVLQQLDEQLATLLPRLESISEQRSLYRYAPDKWSLRQVLGHINDCERLFTLRAFWFARGFDTPLPSFDQNICVQAAEASEIAWSRHVDEFRVTRVATIAFFRNLPEDARLRSGIASDNRFTVRALAFLAVGHVTHHWKIVEERYMRGASA
jgi:DinB superfamily